jgi:hypothetical protein
MSKSNWAVGFAGAGTLSGDFVRAEYEHVSGEWLIRYLVDGVPVTSSAAPRHPSLRMLAADAAGEKRVIKTAFAVIDQIEEGVHERVRRDLAPPKPRRRAPRRATA